MNEFPAAVADEDHDVLSLISSPAGSVLRTRNSDGSSGVAQLLANHAAVTLRFKRPESGLIRSNVRINRLAVAHFEAWTGPFAVSATGGLAIRVAVGLGEGGPCSLTQLAL